MPKNKPRNPPFLLHFHFYSLAPFINKLHSSGDLTIFIISYIALLEIINLMVPKPKPLEFWDLDLKILLCVPASATDAAIVNPSGIKTLSAVVLSTCFLNGIPVFNKDLRSLLRNLPHCIILAQFLIT